MVRSVERIEQEIAALDRSVIALTQEFHDTYRQYLDALGQAIRQQLILAGYHLCTHGYPERFLTLSLNQRQQLQQTLRELAKQAHEQLLHRVAQHPLESDAQPSKPSFATHSPDLSPDSATDLLPETSLDGSDLEAGFIATSSLVTNSSDDSPPSEDGQDIRFSESEAVSPPLSEPVSSPETIAEPMSNLSQPFQIALSSDRPVQMIHASVPPLHPKRLAVWQEELEHYVVETLQELSHAANLMLQQLEILPNRLPEPVLEVAAKADISAEATASPPNLLNLLIESESEELQETNMTQFIAIRLRLSEIEFSNSSTTIWRSKIRELSAQLHKLGREYQKKLKERSVAQAEAAWRSSWFED